MNPGLRDTNVKIMRSLCRGFECQSALSSRLLNLCDWHILLWCKNMQFWRWGFQMAVYWEKMCGLETRGLSEDVQPRCLNNSLLAICFHLNWESYTSHYLFVFSWHLIKQSPQCSARFQIYSAVHERGSLTFIIQKEESQQEEMSVFFSMLSV